MILIGLPSIALIVPFQILHADIGNLEFLGKSTINPKYFLLFTDLFAFKVYVYPMKTRKSIANKMEILYKEVEKKRKGQKTRLQTDQEFKQKKYFPWTKNTMLTCFPQPWEAVKYLLPSKNSGSWRKEYSGFRLSKKNFKKNKPV